MSPTSQRIVVTGDAGFLGSHVVAALREKGFAEIVDTSRAERLFGLRATTSFEGALKRTIEWYRKQRLAPSPML